MHSSPLFRLTVYCSWLLAGASAHSALAPVGYTAAINTPTADAMPWGDVQVAWTNNNPEMTRRQRGHGPFGSLTVGFGVVPGLELVGRLASDGNPQCNMYLSGCPSSLRDLSFSGKYQLPWELPLNTRVAIGVSDYGGAATHFKQAYGVATSTWGAWQWSLGVSQDQTPRGRQSLMNGPFASALWQIDDHWRLAGEYDSQAWRIGVQYNRPITQRLDLEVGLSQRIAAGSTQPQRQGSQASIGFRYALEAAQGRSTQLPTSVRDQAFWHAPQRASMEAPEAVLARPAPTTSVATPPLPLDTAQAIAMQQRLSTGGFTQVHVGVAAGVPRLWVIQAESTRWRQQPLQGVGALLHQWLQGDLQDADRIHLTTTYMGVAVHTATTSRACALAFGDPTLPCDANDGLRWADALHPIAQPATTWLATPSLAQGVRAEVEVGPSLAYTLGTEYGLFDYDLALDTGWQVPIPGIRGLFWQGQGNTRLSHSQDYGTGRVFGQSTVAEGIQINQLSYVFSPFSRLWVQANAGLITANYQGAQMDAAWYSDNGRWRLGGTVGEYHHVVMGQQTHTPELAQIRFSPVPGRWALEATGGRFFFGDKGFKLASTHWFGEHRLSLYYRRTSSPTMPQTAFAGVTFEVPLGPSQAAQWGPATLRGRDQWTVGLSTKVGATDNKLTSGYGSIPTVRHGLTDIMDGDRAGGATDTAHQRWLIQQGLKP